ncbi:hypothetical protein RRG08_052035 [Elysia crispata]|uniref:Uncharacterized protein n=1 Tax=Elysia crispata TaxID=231223 RepID=A0AAE1A569_9GAST|nr:hypothetical protein RRG08_052035 [Elysia crispata]
MSVLKFMYLSGCPPVGLSRGGVEKNHDVSNLKLDNQKLEKLLGISTACAMSVLKFMYLSGCPTVGLSRGGVDKNHDGSFFRA